MCPSACPARPDTVRQSTPPATSWVTMKWRRSWRRQLTPSRRARRRNRWEMPSGSIGFDPSGAWGETEAAGARGGPPAGGSLAWGAQQLDRAGAYGDAALGVGLGVLVDKRLPGDADHVAGDQDLAAVKVDIGPAQGTQLAAPGAEHNGQT